MSYDKLRLLDWPALQILVRAVDRIVELENRASQQDSPTPTSEIPTYRDIMDRIQEV